MSQPLLALTLKHPWPFAICRLYKDVENRTWQPPRALRGRYFAIHGGKIPASKNEREWVEEEAIDLIDEHGDHLTSKGMMPAENLLGGIYLTGIVAVARLADVVTEATSPWFDGPVGWVLDDVTELPRPVPCKGAQGLWQVPEDIAGRVREQWLEATGYRRTAAHERMSPELRAAAEASWLQSHRGLMYLAEGGRD